MRYPIQSCQFFLPLLMMLVVNEALATEFRVGGAQGWTVPADPSTNPYNQWAERNRFRIGDSLLFVYSAGLDTVLRVTGESYNRCITDGAMAAYSDGNTPFKFNQSGPHYFISGTDGNCLKNEKMVVVVMADRSNRSSTSNGTTAGPPPPPTEIAPSPPPEMSPPGIAPAGEESPSPPPPPSGNGASSMVASLAALLGTSLLLAL